VTDIILPNGFTPRPEQERFMGYMDNGGLRAACCWPRRYGKDLTAVHQTVKLAHERPGMYFHLLPNHKQARKVLWDAYDNDGRRIIDTAIPPLLRESTNEAEMKIKLKCGGIWQLVGADYYDSLMGSNPFGLVFSEAALTDPRAWGFFRPILAGNGGWAAFISTPRGYNWFHDLLKHAQQDPHWFASHLTALQTGHIPEAVLAQERREMADELFRQEYLCDFSAANVGAILGRYIEDAEREARISDAVVYDPGAPLYVSMDLGHRDAAAAWWWQPQLGGYNLLAYREETGLDADDWIGVLQEQGYPITELLLPHDARAKTFASKRSVIEQMSESFRCRIVPISRISDRINAGRTVVKRCRFNAEGCERGLMALREWSFSYNEERRAFSAEPDHNWASHGADAFTYGAQALSEQTAPAPIPVREDPQRGLRHGANYGFALDDLWEGKRQRR
jgi:phage terminase large subunit